MIKPLVAVCLLLTFTASAQAAAPGAPAADALEPAALAPFVASYEVSRRGRALGEATMQVTRQPSSRWRIDLVMRGTRGLPGLAGINAEQSTVFDTAAGTYRPLSQATVGRTLFTRKQTVGTYDWPSRSARWHGDVKEHRTGPVTLQRGDMSGLLINLAVIRDAEPGKTLQYRFVDKGRARDHRYVVAIEPESVTVGDLAYSAMRVDRVVGDGSEETTIWVVEDVPTPIRLLQRKDGEDTYDLRLVEYRGVQ